MEFSLDNVAVVLRELPWVAILLSAGWGYCVVGTWHKFFEFDKQIARLRGGKEDESILDNKSRVWQFVLGMHQYLYWFMLAILLSLLQTFGSLYSTLLMSAFVILLFAKVLSVAWMYRDDDKKWIAIEIHNILDLLVGISVMVILLEIFRYFF